MGAHRYFTENNFFLGYIIHAIISRIMTPNGAPDIITHPQKLHIGNALITKHLEQLLRFTPPKQINLYPRVGGPRGYAQMKLQGNIKIKIHIQYIFVVREF